MMITMHCLWDLRYDWKQVLTSVGALTSTSSSFSRIIVLGENKNHCFVHHLLVLRLRYLGLTASLASPGYQAECWQCRCKDTRSPQGLMRAPSELRHSPAPQHFYLLLQSPHRLQLCYFILFFRSFSVTTDLVVAGHFTTGILLVAVVNKPDCA